MSYWSKAEKIVHVYSHFKWNLLFGHNIKKQKPKIIFCTLITEILELDTKDKQEPHIYTHLLLKQTLKVKHCFGDQDYYTKIRIYFCLQFYL